MDFKQLERSLTSVERGVSLFDFEPYRIYRMLHENPSPGTNFDQFS